MILERRVFNLVHFTPHIQEAVKTFFYIWVVKWLLGFIIQNSERPSTTAVLIITVTIRRSIFVPILVKKKLNHRRLHHTKLFFVQLQRSSNQHWPQEVCALNDCRCAKKASFPWNHSLTRNGSTQSSMTTLFFYHLPSFNVKMLCSIKLIITGAH